MSGLIDWLYASAASQEIQNTPWVIPTVQSVHIMAICVLFGSSLMICLRLLGSLTTDGGVIADVGRRFVPWIWGAVAVLAISGVTLVVGEPERVLNNPVFGVKMALLAAELLLALGLNRKVAQSDSRDASPGLRSMGIVALGLWVAIICCGRWIAYAM